MTHVPEHLAHVGSELAGSYQPARPPRLGGPNPEKAPQLPRNAEVWICRRGCRKTDNAALMTLPQALNRPSLTTRA